MNEIYKFSEILGREEEFIGKEIEITGLEEYCQFIFNVNMRCIIADVIKHDWDSQQFKNIQIVLDFKPFEKYNFFLMCPNLMDETVNAKLKWMETFQDMDGKSSIYITINTKFKSDQDKNTFRVLPEKTISIMKAFDTSNETNYINFMESIISVSV